MKLHNEGTWFTCHICQKKFSCKGKLKVHIQRHEGVKPYVCHECQKCFCTAGELRKHQLVHSDFKGFCCGLCGKDFKRSQAVKRHFRWCSDGVDCDSILWSYYLLLLVWYHFWYYRTFLLVFYAIVSGVLTCCSILSCSCYEISYDIDSAILINKTKITAIIICSLFMYSKSRIIMYLNTKTK